MIRADSSSSAEQPSMAGQIAIVTGAASGIGRAVTTALALKGVIPVAVDLNMADVSAIVEQVRAQAGVPGLALVADVRDEQQVEELTRRTLAEFGRIDILVACAGILRMRDTVPKPLVELTTPEWDAVLDTNLHGLFYCLRAVLPSMIAHRYGQIVTLSSTSGRQGRALDSAYCASKFGVIGLTEAVAEEVRSYGVRTVAVIPDAVATPIWEQNGPVPPPSDALPPERVAELIVYLLGLPRDAVLINPVLAPFRSRRRVRKPDGLAVPAESAQH